MRLWLWWTAIALTIQLYHLSASEISSECRPGWSLYNKRCYKVYEELETLNNAAFTCALHGGVIAYGFHQDDFDFLKTLMDKHDNFRYWYGAWVTMAGNFYSVDIRNHEGQYISSEMMHGYRVEVPKHAFYEREVKGQDISIYEKTGDGEYHMLSVDGRIQLPFICKLPAGEAPKIGIKDDHFFKVKATNAQNTLSTEWFWLSDKMDLKSKSDADRKCKEMSMTLASIRDKDQMRQLFEEIKQRVNERIASRHHPIWIGLEESNGNFRWGNGDPLNSDVLSWQTQPPVMTITVRTLLYDATLFQDWDAHTAPFICMVNSTVGETFGCPQGWIRAGPSCYFTHFEGNNRQTANRLCSKVDSELMSFKSRQEMEWFRISKEVKHFGTQFWTSLNNMKNPTKYVWQDGSALSQEVMNWDRMLTGMGDFYYAEFIPNVRIRKTRGQETKYPGCQYPNLTGRRCATIYWASVGQFCYFVNARASKATYDTMLHTCYQYLPTENQNISIEPLVIRDQRVMMLYRGNLMYNVWVAKVDVVDEVAVWPDGTPLNKTVFDNTPQPDVGTPKDPKHCVLVNQHGFYETANCESTRSVAICKKDAPLKTRNSANSQDGRNLGPIVLIGLIVLLPRVGV